MWWMFFHGTKAFLRKDKILMPFTNSYNYRVLIVVGWVYQSKVLVYSSMLSKRFCALWHEDGSWGIGCHPTNMSHMNMVTNCCLQMSLIF
jgi:hypothetical protein